ncbi:MAG: hypothetical protein [Caudoviricetes sp.]|nr:MAG: hypothetical protein [Caudoviricetes sp.]
MKIELAPTEESKFFKLYLYSKERYDLRDLTSDRLLASSVANKITYDSEDDLRFKLKELVKTFLGQVEQFKTEHCAIKIVHTMYNGIVESYTLDPFIKEPMVVANNVTNKIRETAKQ